MRIGKLIITVDHTHDHAPHYGKHALKTSIIAVTVASALTLTVFAAENTYQSHGILKYDQNSDGTAEIELNGAEIQNLGAAAANQEANLENTHATLTTIKDQNTELKTSTTDLSNKVEGLASTVQGSLANNGVCMNTDGGSSGVIGNYKQALASASSDYNSTAYSGSKTNSSNLNLSDSINCINNIGKLPADHSDNVVGITALSDNDLKDFTTAHPDAPTAEQKTAGNEKGINYTSQLMAGSGAWMADDGGLKWYEGTTVNKGSINAILTSDQNSITLPAGYYNGISVSADISNLKGNVTYTLVHHHTGSATSGGGCYTVPQTTTTNYGGYCNQRYEYTRDPGKPWAYQQIDYHGTCEHCGKELYNAWEPKWVKCPNCNTSSITYTCGCGLNEGDFVRETNDFSSINDNEKISKVTITY